MKKHRDSYSQLGQDNWVLEKLDYKENGFFVEAGISDGIYWSNTYLLETAYGWTGIGVEAAKMFHSRLKEARNCSLDFNILWDKDDEIEAFHSRGYIGGTPAEFATEWDRLERRLSGNKLELPTISLNSLLLKYNAPSTIDYISLDTEGSELKILQAFDFKAWDVSLWTIEHNKDLRTDGEAYYQSLVSLLSSQGYKHHQKGVDLWFWR